MTRRRGAIGNSMSNNKTPKALTQGKSARRKWLALIRIFRYGVNNFSRNAWLTVAATAVMTITLLIMFMTLVARQVLVDTVDVIKDKVDMSIYVDTETTEEQAQSIKEAIERLSTVKTVTYINPEAGRADFAQQNKSDAQTLDALNEATNKLPGIFRIKVVDINDTTELNKFVNSNELYKTHADPDREPSFQGDRRSAIETIGRWVEFAERGGLIASLVFMVISALIVFNTIRMAIFNRKEEIQMMKLIGADRNFIRGPFIVEAVVYGFIAAILATVIGVGALYAVRDKLNEWVNVGDTVELVASYLGLVILAMILTGAAIGVVSSLLATRKYLKV